MGLGKKNLFNLLLLGIMVLAIPLTIKLARQQQILFSHAAETKIDFLTKEYGGTTYTKPDGSIVSCVVTRGSKLVSLCKSVKVRLTAPTGADLTFQGSSGGSNGGGAASRIPGRTTSLFPQIGLVTKAYADNCEEGNYCEGTTLIHKSGCVPHEDDPNTCDCNYPGDANSPSCGGGGSVTCGDEYAKDLGGGRAQNTKDCSDGTHPTSGDAYCIDSSQHIVGDHCESGGSCTTSWNETSHECVSCGKARVVETDSCDSNNTRVKSGTENGIDDSNCDASHRSDLCGSGGGGGGSKKGQVCDGYNQVFEDGTKYCHPGVWQDDGGTQCGYNDNPSNTHCDLLGCSSGQQEISSLNPTGKGDYLVSDQVVNESLQPWQETDGACGYKYYVGRSSLPNGHFCVDDANNFGAWADQED